MKIKILSAYFASYGHDGIAKVGNVYEVQDAHGNEIIQQNRAEAVTDPKVVTTHEEERAALESEAAKKPTKEEAAATAKQEKQDAKDEAKEEADAKKEAAHHKHDKH